MKQYNISRGTSFYAIGLSYKKADAVIRGHFSLNEEAKLLLLEQAKNEGIESLIITSTCNRTEIYGFAEHPYQLIKLLCDNTVGTVEEFQKVAYIYKNIDFHWITFGLWWFFNLLKLRILVVVLHITRINYFPGI